MKRTIWDYLTLAEIGNRLRSAFELWGYREVIFPAIEEYSEDVRKGTKFAHCDGFYLINPDVTSRIIKNLGGESARMYYISEVLDGGIRGRWEAGMELIGGKDVAMHVEAILVAITALESLGIEEFYIDIGSLKVWEGAISGIPLFREEVFLALQRRNFEIIESLPISAGRRHTLWRLFNFRGKSSGVKKLDAIIEAVDDERVFLDFGTVRPLPYYTDVIFEIYSPKLGKPIGGGGEYEISGKKAIGFALDMNALLKLYKRKERERKRIEGSDIGEVYSKARELVKLGIPVEVGV